MPSFEMIYDEDEDVLEVTFAAFDEQFSRTISLNDNITIYTDLMFKQAWGITIYGYQTLLRVNETDMDGLRPLSEVDVRRVLGLLTETPLSHFLELVAPDEFRARLRTPHLNDLLK